MANQSGLVKESLGRLRQLEQQYRQKPQELRVRALRLLKAHPGWTMDQVAEVLGRSARTLYRWWGRYQRTGLSGALEVGQVGGKRPSRLSAGQLQQLQKRLQQEGFADLYEAQRFVVEQFGVHYSYTGIGYLMRVRLKAKPKTGRPKAKGQDAQALRAFKKKVWRR